MSEQYSGDLGIGWVSSDVRLSEEDTALVPSLPLFSPNIMWEKRGRTGTDTTLWFLGRTIYTHELYQHKQIPGSHSTPQGCHSTAIETGGASPPNRKFYTTSHISMALWCVSHINSVYWSIHWAHHHCAKSYSYHNS